VISPVSAASARSAFFRPAVVSPATVARLPDPVSTRAVPPVVESTPAVVISEGLRSILAGMVGSPFVPVQPDSMPMDEARMPRRMVHRVA